MHGIDLQQQHTRTSCGSAAAREYLESGVRQVWIIEPAMRTVTVYRSLDDIQTIREHGLLDGDSIVPGFQLSIASLFT